MANTNVKQFKFTGDATFSVRIYFRQNASYQGELYWVEGEQRINFRSLFEMIMLIQEAVNISGEPKEEYKLRSWKEIKETVTANR